ncbi:conserved membrane hypothetical protein [Mesorhizobium sp. SOD10]|nr:conserved membrane hypothetical protein [Mesorhizobium sp. SOD10]
MGREVDAFALLLDDRSNLFRLDRLLRRLVVGGRRALIDRGLPLGLLSGLVAALLDLAILVLAGRPAALVSAQDILLAVEERRLVRVGGSFALRGIAASLGLIVNGRLFTRGRLLLPCCGLLGKRLLGLPLVLVRRLFALSRRLLGSGRRLLRSRNRQGLELARLLTCGGLFGRGLALLGRLLALLPFLSGLVVICRLFWLLFGRRGFLLLIELPLAQLLLLVGGGLLGRGRLALLLLIEFPLTRLLLVRGDLLGRARLALLLIEFPLA